MTDDPTAPSLTANPLWTRARAMFARALAVLGAISAIAARRTLTPEVRRQIVAWLAPLEHIVRKLLLAEAAALRQSAKAYRTVDEVKPALCVQSRDRVQTQRTAQPSNSLPSGGSERLPKQIDLSHPETWTARFSFAAPRDPLSVPESRAPRIRALWGATPPPAPPPPRLQRAVSAADAPFRLARRLEAIRRVLENPLPHAERLARLLARAVRRFPEIVRRYLHAPARGNGYDKADPRLSVDALRTAWNAPEVITDSS